MELSTLEEGISFPLTGVDGNWQEILNQLLMM
jgi:hypothetical protein